MFTLTTLLTATLSLQVPEQKHGRASEVIVTTDDGVDSRSGTALSRRDSADSRLSGASTVDFSKLLPMQALGGNERGNEDDQDNAITSSDSYIRSAIPCLPLWFAIVCLILNTCLPGFGQYSDQILSTVGSASFNHAFVKHV